MAAISVDVPTAFANAAPDGQTPQATLLEMQLLDEVDLPAVVRLAAPDQSWVAPVLSLSTPTVPDILPPVVSTSQAAGVSTLNQGLN
jgi:hypothetical protein